MAGAATDPALLATLPLVFGIMTFCYSGHGVFPSIQASMKEPEKFPQVDNGARGGVTGLGQMAETQDRGEIGAKEEGTWATGPHSGLQSSRRASTLPLM